MAVACIPSTFTIVEGQTATIDMIVSDIRNISFSYSWSDSPIVGTATGFFDVSSNTQSGQITRTGLPSSNETFSFEIRANADNVVEPAETYNYRLTLEGLLFDDGTSSRDILVTILNNSRPTGELVILNDFDLGAFVVDTSGISDPDGLGSFQYQWSNFGSEIEGETSNTLFWGTEDFFNDYSVSGRYLDEGGSTATLQAGTERPLGLNFGTVENDSISGTTGEDRIYGLGGADFLEGEGGNDTINGGDGNDTINGGEGNDRLFGGSTVNDIRDNIFGENGDDYIDGGYGNDNLNGGAGNDLIIGGFGSDTLIGNSGNDTLSGQALGDVIFGGDGDDFINGGFGFDRLNGGAGADTFFHLGVANHGSDWIQDFTAQDVLAFGGTATAAQFLINFQVNIANTAGAGDADIDEAFVIYTLLTPKPEGFVLK